MSIWNQDNIRDVAEAVGIPNLSKDVADNLARDVEFRIGQVLEEALKFMRHARRTTLNTQDIAQALRILDVEPLYGYESTRPLRFSEATIGPGQLLYYVEDEEVDFEKLINAPLPKVPREISFTAHWLAVDGVQPSIPQNPTTSSATTSELLPKGPGASVNLAALNGYDNVSVKPVVKHIVSKELQLYFARTCGAILDESNDEYREAAFSSLENDTGLHQLVAYFVNFVAEKVTHNSKNIFVMEQMMRLLEHLLKNTTLHIDPYISATVPSVLSCLIGKHIGPKETNPVEVPKHFEVRELAASVLEYICRKYSKASQSLKPRIVRTLLKHFLDANKPLGTHYGAILGLRKVLGIEGVIQAVVPNLKAYDPVLADAIKDETKQADVKKVVGLLEGLLTEVQKAQSVMVNGHPEPEGDLREQITEKIGPLFTDFVMSTPTMARALLFSDIPFA